ncbi:MAG: hypothetical protein LBT82_03985, partial [Oscillospiraceae bacterium]|nr:hypothetical protein [Oscillospiraceae bacterium]
QIQNDFLIFKVKDINEPFAVNKVDVIPMKEDTEKFLKESVFEQAIVTINTCNKVYFDTFEKFLTTATLNSEKMPASSILQQIFIENEPWNNKSLMPCLEFVILLNLNPIDLILKNEDGLFVKKIFFDVILQEISKYLEEMPSKQGYEYELFHNLREEIARLL